MIRIRLAAAAMLCAAAAPASAQTLFSWSGSWEISRGKAVCTMRQVDRAGTTEIVIKDSARGYGSLEVRGAGWPYVSGQEYDMVLTTKRWTVSAGSGWGLPVKEGRGGFSMSFLSGGIPGLVSPRTIRVRTLRPKLPDRSFIMPSGMGALRDLDRCVAESKHDELGSGAPVVTPARLRGTQEDLMTEYDYPILAIRSQISGTVTVRLTVTAVDYANTCLVTASSGSALLDRATCDTYLKRARFEPALDAEGRATVGSLDLTKVWMLPPVQK